MNDGCRGSQDRSGEKPAGTESGLVAVGEAFVVCGKQLKCIGKQYTRCNLIPEP